MDNVSRGETGLETGKGGGKGKEDEIHGEQGNPEVQKRKREREESRKATRYKKGKRVCEKLA